MLKWHRLGCKKIPKHSEVAMKTSSSRDSKRAHTWHSCMLAPKSLYASPWIRPGLGWPERDFRATIKLCQVGARFEALYELVFMVPSEFFAIFLQPYQCHLSIVPI